MVHFMAAALVDEYGDLWEQEEHTAYEAALKGAWPVPTEKSCKI
eukprot:SAG11_NODE_34519_length_271_cov_1.174419_1_plen_44_part_00